MSAALLAILVVGFAVSVGAMTAPLWRGRRQVDAGDRETTSQNELEAEIQLAVDELSEVETEYADGYLDRDEYVSERRQSEARVRELRRRRENRISVLERAIDARVSALNSGVSGPVAGDGAGLARERSEVTAARSEAPSTSRRGVLIGAGSVAGLAFVLVVIALVSFGRAAPPRTPVAEVVLQDYRAVVGFGGRAIDGLILAHGAGIHLSGDGGSNWAPVYGGGPVNSLAVSPGVVYIASQGLFTATDLQSEWREITPPGSSGEFVAAAVNPAAAYAITAIDSAGYVFVSADAGGSWERLPVAAPSSTRSLTIMPMRGLMYIGTTDQGVLGGDGRDEWASANGFVNGALPTVHAPSIFYDARSGDSFEGVNGRFEGALYVGTDRGVFKSIDGGASWNLLELEVAVRALTVSRGDPSVITAVDGRGRVFRSADRGLSWDYGAR
ncbi:MAG: hypothetical protein OXG11_09710 [Chloroflexi bacterium]|nr:hypothetical protein [Chloroflexota bacterium]